MVLKYARVLGSVGVFLALVSVALATPGEPDGGPTSLGSATVTAGSASATIDLELPADAPGQYRGWWYKVLMNVYEGILATFKDMAYSVAHWIDGKLEGMAPEYLDLFAPVVYFLECANEWLPVKQAAGYSAALQAFRIVIIAYRLVKSWIPSVSGG